MLYFNVCSGAVQSVAGVDKDNPPQRGPYLFLCFDSNSNSKKRTKSQ